MIACKGQDVVYISVSLCMTNAVINLLEEGMG